MRRRLSTAALVIVLGALASVPAAGAQDALRLTEVGGTSFPHRSFILTLPRGTDVDASRVQVRENGHGVSKLSVVPASEAGRRFGAVLVIDASNSMRGSAIDAAMEAARAFAARRNPEQRLAIVAFNDEASVLLPFTAETRMIEQALAGAPALDLGTKVYDAVAVALRLLREAKIAAGSIIVLSDGADTGSATAGATVAAAARNAGVRVFGVGLRSRSFTPSSLERLAEASGGEYSEATSANDLASIFDEIGERLASEYLLRYRSLAGPEVDVRVDVTVEGVEATATSEYATPALPQAGEPYRRPIGETFWRSSLAMLVVALATAGLLAGAALAVFMPRRRDLRTRMGEFVTLAVSGDDLRDGALGPDGGGARPQPRFERFRWWVGFNELVELAEIRVPAGHITAAVGLGTVAAAFLLYGVGSIVLVPLALAVPFLARSLVLRKVESRRKAFAEQLPDNLQVLSSALRAGHSLVGAISVVVDDAPEPARSEFRRIIADEQLGASLEDAFAGVVRRMDNGDLEQVALVAALQRETGGNTAEVLDRVCDTIRERFDLRRLVRTLTAQGRMSRWVVSLLPVGLLTLITLLNPAYMKPLFTHPIGRVMLLVAAVMVVAGSFVIKKIVDIKV